MQTLAMPSEEAEARLTYYNTATAWIDIGKLLAASGLRRDELGDEEKVTWAVRNMAARMSTYITLKDVKKRWGKGQEDVFPVAQYEKLGGYDGAAGPRLPVRGGSAGERAAVEGACATGWVAAGWVGGV